MDEGNCVTVIHAPGFLSLTQTPRSPSTRSRREFPGCNQTSWPNAAASVWSIKPFWTCDPSWSRPTVASLFPSHTLGIQQANPVLHDPHLRPLFSSDVSFAPSTSLQQIDALILISNTCFNAIGDHLGGKKKCHQLLGDVSSVSNVSDLFQSEVKLEHFPD